MGHTHAQKKNATFSTVVKELDVKQSMPSISEKPRIVYIHSNFDIQQYSTQYELQSERKCLFFLNIINPFKDEYCTTNEYLHQTVVKILLKHLKTEIRSQYNCWPMYNISSSSLSLKYLYTTTEQNKENLPSDIICKGTVSSCRHFRARCPSSVH